MRIVIKSLDGKQFGVDVSLETLTKDLKALVAEAKPEMVVERQKLVFQGKIMADDKPLSFYGLTENAFVVVMVVKLTAAQRAAAEAEAAEAEEGEAGEGRSNRSCW